MNHFILNSCILAKSIIFLFIFMKTWASIVFLREKLDEAFFMEKMLAPWIFNNTVSSLKFHRAFIPFTIRRRRRGRRRYSPNFRVKLANLIFSCFLYFFIPFISFKHPNLNYQNTKKNLEKIRKIRTKIIGSLYLINKF